MNKFSLLIALLISVPAFAQTNVLFMGGGGEGAKPDTIFDDSLVVLGKKKTELNFKLQSCFNGGHSVTERLIQDNVSGTNQDFTLAHYHAMIDEYVRKINAGEIKSGEKLLVIVDTHGAKADQYSKTHSIAMSGDSGTNLSDLAGSKLGSMDDLKKLTDLAAAKGIKLGIVDMSCHSGNSLPLANANTCVISASGPNHFGFSDFSAVFYSQMKAGRSLEDVFLETRKHLYDSSYPMISTKAGKAVQDEEYPLFTPYLNTISSDGKGDKLTPYLKATILDPNCNRDQSFAKLMEQVSALQTTVGTAANSYDQSLVTALQNYKKLQDDMLKKLKDANYAAYDQNKEKISYPDPVDPRKTKIEELTWRDILFYYSKDSGDYFKQELRRTTNKVLQTEYKSLIAKFEVIDAKRQQLKAAHPELVTSSNSGQALLDSLKTQSNQIYNSTNAVARLADKLYQKNYQDRKSAETGGSEPCRDFVL